ncbi:MAG: thiamine diphosphokinase [Clostridia bacterium]|nr:thiamine diphosphokinase [Clostridia bacterium]
MRAVIIGNGSMNDYGYIKGKINKSDYIICADGGYKHCKALGIKPAVLIGDMDSIGDNDYDGEIINLPIRKDFTDSEVCIKFILLKDFEEILMFGFIGTRMDHTVTNILLLKQIAEAGKKAHIIDEHNDIMIAGTENIIYGKKGDLISIIPVSGNLCGVTTNGLSYPLSDETLVLGESRGVSNFMTSNKCQININSGMGIIVKARD